MRCFPLRRIDLGLALGCVEREPQQSYVGRKTATNKEEEAGKKVLAQTRPILEEASELDNSEEDLDEEDEADEGGLARSGAGTAKRATKRASR